MTPRCGTSSHGSMAPYQSELWLALQRLLGKDDSHALTSSPGKCTRTCSDFLVSRRVQKDLKRSSTKEGSEGCPLSPKGVRSLKPTLFAPIDRPIGAC
uniref:Uncharacterized protein n=1 Tax=Steinernema glaseri TaxID=37863 RepID=A0A1I7Y2F8_9BILA